MNKILLPLVALVFMSGCSMSTYVKLPEGSELTIKRGEQKPHSEGLLTSRPMSWSSAGGIPYKLEKDGEVIQEGKLRAKFRPVSIFWPPAAIIYWPMGFRHACYDLSSDTAENCTPETYAEMKLKHNVGK